MASTYIVTLRVSTDDGVDAERIEEEIYAACEDVPFSFDIAAITEEDRG